ncbi:hypothetical protein H3H37_00315 [Duganella sp. LX20W]|uniref:Uncharacterized protein n=1 Tax=Rugamonas brunnea TaxID=2758569 RepID=A0A7W2EN41_9BURK|nr:hypothetical protein [Rugamonas brunnea]MBA5635512.1 hypothetical protein [Rugamonas brunnea]
MRKFAFCLLLLFLTLSGRAIAADCELEARVDYVAIQNCDGERHLGTINGEGGIHDPVRFDAIPLGIEKFWSDICQCYLWQVSGIAGAHTHVARFLQNDAKGNLVLIPGGEFGSEIGKISRVSQALGFTVEVRDADVSGKRRTFERYRFDGKRFLKIK